MKIAVMGACHTLGWHAAKAVLDAGHSLVLIDDGRQQPDLAGERRLADPLDYAALTRALSELDGVIHCPGAPSRKVPRWQDALAEMLDRSNHFYAACLAARVPRILHVGTAMALPAHPRGLPGHEALVYSSMPHRRDPELLCAWALDQQARELARNGLPVIVGLSAPHVGESTGGISPLIRAVGSGALGRCASRGLNLIDAAEAGRGLLLALERGRVGERYLLAGQNIGLAELCRRIATLLGVTPPKLLSPGIAALVRLVGGSPLPEAGWQFLESDKARAELGFIARTPLETSLRQSIGWLRGNGFL
jgi:dihydroflavonol-4-reductase